MPELFETDTDLDFWAAPTGDPPEDDAPAATAADTAPEVVADVAPADTADTAETEATSRHDYRENGKFAKDPGKEEVSAEETPAETEARLLAGKFKTADELEAAYAELQSLTGRQGQELGQYRQWYEQQQAQARPQTPPTDVEQLQERLYENQHAIIPTIEKAHQAALAGDPNARTVRNAALATLRDLNAVVAEEMSQAIVMSEMQARQQEQTQASAQLDGAWQQAVAEFAAATPDFNQFAPQIAAVADRPENADLLKLLEVGGPKARISVLRVFYNEARAQATDKLNAASTEIARSQAEEAIRAAQDAAVATTTNSKPDPGPPNMADRIAAEWEAIEAPHRDGWNIR